MFPVLFSIGSLSVSSFGVFLGLSLLFGIFLIWRLARAWDLDEEKVLDLTILVLISGLIVSRLYFIFEHFSVFGFDPFKWIVFYKYPGFSFWGAFLGGWLGLFYFSPKKRFDFWLLSDIASIGFLGSLILSNIGCFLGGCNIGVVSNFLSVPMVGAVGKRFPVQILESILLSLIVWKMWSKVTHFHKSGTISAACFFLFGLIRLVLAPLKANRGDFIFSISLMILGLTIFYKVTNREIISDIRNFFLDSKFRKEITTALAKNWYNQKIVTRLIRRLNVSISHKNSKFY